MDHVERMLQDTVDSGLLPGAVAASSRAGSTQVTVLGVQDLTTQTPMSRSSLFHWDSLGKPLTAALALTFVADGTLDLDSPIDRWLPELTEPQVLIDAGGDLSRTVPAERAVTVEDLLTLRGGLGFTPDFDSPIVEALITRLQEGPTSRTLSRQEFLAAVGELPLVHQPGQGWTYNLGSTLLGLLVERAGDAPLDELMASRLFTPLGMADARWWVPEQDRARFTSRYGTTDDAEQPLTLIDPADGMYASPPSFPDGAGGIIGTADDWLAFGQMLLGYGVHHGRRLLPEALVRAMMTDQLTAEQQRGAGPFLADGEGWGYGGSVRADGTYGWSGGAGVTARVDPTRDRVDILFTQVALDGPDGSPTTTVFEEIVGRCT